MTRLVRRAPMVLGLVAFFAFAAGAIVWPVTQGYPTLVHLLGDRIIPDYLPRYDRAPLVADLEQAHQVIRARAGISHLDAFSGYSGGYPGGIAEVA